MARSCMRSEAAVCSQKYATAVYIVVDYLLFVTEHSDYSLCSNRELNGEKIRYVVPQRRPRAAVAAMEELLLGVHFS